MIEKFLLKESLIKNKLIKKRKNQWKNTLLPEE